MKAALDSGLRAVDVGKLEFIDVSAMRAMVEVARSSSAGLELRGVSAGIRRHWKLVGVDTTGIVRLEP